MSTPPENTPDQSKTFFVMVDFDTTVADFRTIEEARREGQKLCDAELLPLTFTIEDEDGNVLETIERSDRSTLSQKVAEFNAFSPRRPVREKP